MSAADSRTEILSRVCALITAGAAAAAARVITDSYPFVPAAPPRRAVTAARGGLDGDDSNIVTTSMLRNSAKAHWLLEELGWRLHPAAPRADWDGLLGWFRAQVRERPELVKHVALRRWRAAAERQTSAMDGKGSSPS